MWDSVYIFTTFIRSVLNPAMVAWLAKVSVFHSVNSSLSANGGLNPARDVYMVPWPLLLVIIHHICHRRVLWLYGLSMMSEI